LYFSLNVLTVVKSRRMGWAGCIARNTGIISAGEMLIGKRERYRFFRTRVEKEGNIKMNNWKLAVSLVWPAVRTC
jgi:hypothetical protein